MKNEISKYLYITGEIKNVKNMTGTVLPIEGGIIETTVKNTYWVIMKSKEKAKSLVKSARLLIRVVEI